MEGVPTSEGKGGDAARGLPPDWREALFSSLVTGIGWPGLVVVVIWIATSPPAKMHLAPWTGLGTMLIFIVLARVRTPRLGIRAVIVCILLMIAATAGLLQVGPMSGVGLTIATAIVFAAVVLGRKAAYIFGGVSSALYLTCGWLVTTNRSPMWRPSDGDFKDIYVWIRVGAYSLILTLAIAITISDVVARLEKFLSVAEDALGRLERESKERQEAEERQSRAEVALLAAQRLEAVGRLAGGIAHDFNNLLLVIMSWADILRGAHAPSELQEGLSSISQSATQAAHLTRQLLSFARQDLASPEPLALDREIGKIAPSLRRLINPGVSISLSAKPVPPVLFDRNQLHQIIFNLSINAADAMPLGGSLQFSTELIPANRLPADATIRDRSHVALHVQDSGTGMDEATASRVFEPYFTTKPRGSGTGLGLAMVYGLVHQLDGYITLRSEIGRGTTFTVGFPIAKETLLESTRTARRVLAAGPKTILLVDDETAIRALMKKSLEREGHAVLEASTVDEALPLLRRHREEIHLLITDAVMPGMPVPQLIDEARRLFPDIQVLIVSGYVAGDLLRRAIAENDYAVLAKPFGGDALLTTVEKIFAGRNSFPPSQHPG